MVLGTLAFGGAMALGLGSASADSYTVKSGDTLNAIAQEHNTTAQQLGEDNRIDNINLIYVGDVLSINEGKVPAKTTPAVTVPVAPVVPVQPKAPVVAPQAPVQQAPVVIAGGSAKEWIAQRESGGSYTARNGQYVGRYQLTDSYLNGDYSPENQERVADAYVAKRYGGWEQARQAWIAQGWY